VKLISVSHEVLQSLLGKLAVKLQLVRGMLCGGSAYKLLLWSRLLGRALNRLTRLHLRLRKLGRLMLLL
jgi:hypothetical protein